MEITSCEEQTIFSWTNIVQARQPRNMKEQKGDSYREENCLFPKVLQSLWQDLEHGIDKDSRNIKK